MPKKRPVQKRIKGREYELKSSHILHATKDKHQLAHIVESNNHGGSTNGVKARKKQSSGGVEHTQRVKAPPTCTQPIHGGSRLLEGVVWRWGERGVYLGFLLKLLWKEISCWDGISPKRGKYGLRPLHTCHRSR